MDAMQLRHAIWWGVGAFLVPLAAGQVLAAAPASTYLAWLDFSDLDLQPDPHKFVLHKAKVGLNDGAPFGPGGAGCLRLNFACPRERLLEGLERIARAIEDRA